MSKPKHVTVIELIAAPCRTHPGNVHLAVRDVRTAEIAYEAVDADVAISASSGAVSDAYRLGWERVFGGGGDAPN